jgi:photosystem I subunit PsaO
VLGCSTSSPHRLAVFACCCSWTIPSNIPVSAFGGQSLFGLFTQQIGAELAHFPVGPSIDSPFWLYMITWHMGLFACIFW